MHVALEIDAPSVGEAIAERIAFQVDGVLKRAGLVVALSGRIGSSVCAALGARAVGPKRVLGLFMPERESDREATETVTAWARDLGITCREEDLSDTLSAVGYYRRRDEAIRELVPEYAEGWKARLVPRQSTGMTEDTTGARLVLEDPNGDTRIVRVPPPLLRQMVAAMNLKQRLRKMMEYHHSERLDYAVVGAPDLLEHELGCFVKGGGGLADLMPIAHLYRSQVHQLADWLGVPSSATSPAGIPEAFLVGQLRQDSFVSLPSPTVDQLLFLLRQGADEEDVIDTLDLPPEGAEIAVRQLRQMRKAAAHLRFPPLQVDHMA